MHVRVRVRVCVVGQHSLLRNGLALTTEFVDDRLRGYTLHGGGNASCISVGGSDLSHGTWVAAASAPTS